MDVRDVDHLSFKETVRPKVVKNAKGTPACCFWAHWPKIPLVMLIVVVPSGRSDLKADISDVSTWPSCERFAQAFLRICEDEIRRLLLSGSKNNTRMVLTLAGAGALGTW